MPTVKRSAVAASGCLSPARVTRYWPGTWANRPAPGATRPASRHRNRSATAFVSAMALVGGLTLMRNQRSLNLKAIGLGWLVDFVGQLLLVLLVSIVLAAIFMRHPAWFRAEQANIARALAVSVPSLIAQLMVAAIFTVAGGFVTAHLAEESPLVNAGVMGILALLTALLRARRSIFFLPGWYSLLSLLMVLPLAVLGGYWRMVTRKPEATQAPNFQPSADPEPPIPTPL